MSADYGSLSWRALLNTLRDTHDEKEIQRMITAEKRGENRKEWLLRMQGRFKVLRAARERTELIGSK